MAPPASAPPSASSASRRGWRTRSSAIACRPRTAPWRYGTACHLSSPYRFAPTRRPAPAPPPRRVAPRSARAARGAERRLDARPDRRRPAAQAPPPAARPAHWGFRLPPAAAAPLWAGSHTPPPRRPPPSVSSMSSPHAPWHESPLVHPWRYRTTARNSLRKIQGQAEFSTRNRLDGRPDSVAAAVPLQSLAMVPESVVPVRLDSARYDIVVRRELLSEIGPRLAALRPTSKAAVVTDSNVGPLVLPVVTQSLESAGIRVAVATIPAGEDHKTLADIAPVYDLLLSARIERTTPVLALGGGVIGDMAGFVAATVLRGVPFVQVPTSLLAMVDASVGGKTGINHAVGKNLIGAFHQPIAVLIDPEVLATLPERELCGGLAECIKHDIIRDADGFADLERNIGRAVDRDIDYLARLIAHNVAIKARVVEADPFEKGERAHLNFGHTFGHAIETVSHYSYSHGECVALGMTAASRLAADLGMIDESARCRIVSVV